jgi:hypothetical protein
VREENAFLKGKNAGLQHAQDEKTNLGITSSLLQLLKSK